MLNVNHSNAPSLPVSHTALDAATLLLTATCLELQDSEPWLVSMGVVSLIGTSTHTLYTPLAVSAHLVGGHESVLSGGKLSTQAHR